jgi:hypothetical protein
MEKNYFWETNNCLEIQEMTLLLWNTKSSLSCSQEHAVEFYPEPDESSQYLHMLFL